MGAAIFDALESNREDQLRKQYQLTEAGMLQTYNISQDDYNELEEIVMKYQPHKAGAQWKFPGAFYFSLTVITTIGKRFSLSSFVGCFLSKCKYFHLFKKKKKKNDKRERPGAHCVPIKATHDSIIFSSFSSLSLSLVLTRRIFLLIKNFFYIFMCHRCVEKIFVIFLFTPI